MTTQPDGSFSITAFYHFAPIAPGELESFEQRLYKRAGELNIIGLLILAAEGLNGTVAASSRENLELWKIWIQSLPGFEQTEFKDSFSETKPFRRFKVKQRDEIVTLGDPAIVPNGKNQSHLPASEWQRVLEQESDVVVIDTRNTYETQVGKFKGAIDPGIKTFGEFPEWVRNSGIPKDKKVLMYCTGGIRCEKASLEMQRQGYESVFQLDGGILKYLENYPNSQFEGECFVFDHRVAVDQHLMPSKQYHLCPHTGDPATISIQCSICGEAAVVSETCKDQASLHTCSKNCAHHYRRRNTSTTSSEFSENEAY